MGLPAAARSCAIAAIVTALAFAGGISTSGVAHAEGGAVSVSGNRLLRDGAPWIPKGVVITGLISAASTAGKVGPVYVGARERLGPEEIAAVSRFGADTINLKVSQPALDPQGGHYDAQYLAKIKSTVALARAAKLNVVLSMEWGGPTGMTGQENMPTGDDTVAPVSSTTRAWRVLAPVFASDPAIMYQLFDEPCMKTGGPDAWQRWQSGHQAALDAVRESGAKNVAIAEGLRCGKWLTQALPLKDPAHAVAYAVHPYPMPQGSRRSDADMFSASDFDRNFGNWAKDHPVIVTEWHLTTRSACHDGADGNPANPEIATNLLTYLRDHHIGLILWAMDIPNAIWNDQQWQKLSHFEPFHDCKTPNGAGAMVEQYFKTGKISPL